MGDRARERVLTASCLMEARTVREQAIIGGICRVAQFGGRSTLDAFRTGITLFLNDPDTQAMVNGHVGRDRFVPQHPPLDSELLPLLRRWNDVYEKVDLAPS